MYGVGACNVTVVTDGELWAPAGTLPNTTGPSNKDERSETNHDAHPHHRDCNRVGSAAAACSDAETLAHAHGVLRYLVPCSVEDVEPQRGVDAIPRRWLSGRGKDLEVLPTGQMAMEPWLINDRADPRKGLVTILRHGVAEEGHRAGVSVRQPEEDPDKGGLSESSLCQDPNFRAPRGATKSARHETVQMRRLLMGPGVTTPKRRYQGSSRPRRFVDVPGCPPEPAINVGCRARAGGRRRWRSGA